MADGFLECEEGELRCNATPGEPGLERCNTIDDDCDGEVDEEALGVGGICSAGRGACRREGARICREGELICIAEAGSPGDEICNGVDDDCDGVVDDGYLVGRPCALGVGGCEVSGWRACLPDGEVACDAVAGEPSEEICNGVDDDCDGEIDEEVCVDLAPPEVYIELDPPSVGVGEIIQVQVVATDDLRIDRISLSIEGQPIQLNEEGWGSFSADLPGRYMALAQAWDTAGNRAEAQRAIPIRDPSDLEPPYVRLLLPEDRSVLTQRTALLGSVRDDNLAFYQLLISSDGADWQVINEGYEVGEEMEVGVLDPTLLPSGMLQVKLIAEDINTRAFYHQVSYTLPEGLSIGEYRVTLRDLYLPIEGLPISIDRSYDSQDRRQGDFGRGWIMGRSDGFLMEDVNSNVMVTLPDGRREVFSIGYDINPIMGMGPIFYTAPSGVQSRLINLDDCLATAQGICMFSGHSPAETIQRYELITQEGTRYELEQGRGVVKLTDRRGNWTRFDRDAIISSKGSSILLERDELERITAIQDPAGGRILYEYDQRGDLIRVTDQSGGVQSYRYDDEHLLLEIIGPDGHPLARTEYDNEGRKVRQIDAQGGVIQYDHDLEGRRETVTDRRGNQTIYSYDEQGHIIQRIDALGQLTTYLYEGDALIEETDASGATWSYEYTENLRTGIIDPLGQRSSVEYDGFGNPQRLSLPGGRSLGLSYDGQGRQIGVENSAGALISYDYDEDGNRSAYSRADGALFQFQYDEAGQLIGVSGPDDWSQAFEYDALGRLVAQVEADGGRTELIFDAVGRLMGLRLPDESEILVERDGCGRVSALTDANGQRSRYSYDPRGLPVEVEDPLGGITRYEYDPSGNLSAQIDAEGSRWSWSYDALDRPTERLDPLGNLTEIRYDPVGRVLGWTDPDGDRLENHFDALGRVIEMEQASGSVRYSYNEMGFLSQASYPEGVDHFEFDADGRMIRAENPQARLEYSYGPMGQRSQLSTPWGLSRYSYDAFARLEELELPEGGLLRFLWNARGQLQALERPGGISTLYSYDENGRPLAMETRDAEDNLLIREALMRDSAGRVLRVEREDGSQRDLIWDALGRLTSSSTLNAEGVQTRLRRYQYDAVGNRSRMESEEGEVLYRYDAAHRLLEDDLYSYEYDGAGNLIARVDDAGGRERFSYDEQNRLISYARFAPDSQHPESETEYNYDGFGRRISKRVDGALTRYIYDQRQLLLIIEPDGLITRFHHGPNLDHLLGISRGGESYQVILDLRGAVIALLDEEGQVARRQWWDDFGDLLRSEGLVDPLLGFGARPLDLESGLLEFRDRLYDPGTGRFFQVDPEKGERLRPLSQHPYSFALNDPYTTRDPMGRAALVSYSFTVGRIFGVGGSADTPNYYEMMGAFIGFFHGFAATGLVFLANVLEIASGGGDVRDQWGVAMERTQSKMKEIQGLLGQGKALDKGGFVGGYLDGASFQVGISIELKLPEPVDQAMTLGGVEKPERSWTISKSAGGFGSGVDSMLSFIGQLQPR